ARLDLPPRPSPSTQEAFGDVLAALGRDAGVDPRLVTVSADVATTTHLSGWVNRRGVYATRERDDAFERHGLRALVRWKESPRGQHLELGIGEASCFVLLSVLGLCPALARLGEGGLREQVPRAGYRLVDNAGRDRYEPGANVVNLIGVGVMVPEALEASRLLEADGVYANVLALTSPRACYEGWRQGLD